MIHGLVLGKFLPYHAGHAHLIRSARSSVDRLTVLVCSIASEPIPGALRHRWVAESHHDCRVIHVNEEVPQTPAEDPEFWPIWVDLIRRHAGDVDRVFTSEEYGEELGRRLGAGHTQVDRQRKAVPISGTAIRRDPMGSWNFIPAIVQPYFVRRVAIVGAESTGKTTLASKLAERFGTVWVREFGRAYCETRDPLSLTLTDFETIGRGQSIAEEEAVAEANRVLVCDTDLITTCTWSDMIAGGRTSWLDRAARAQRYAMTLLLDADVPWIDDGTRVLERRRAEHTTRLREALDAAGRGYVILGGSYEDRVTAAVREVERLLASTTELPAFEESLRGF